MNSRFPALKAVLAVLAAGSCFAACGGDEFSADSSDGGAGAPGQCANCPPGQTCGGAGIPDKCGCRLATCEGLDRACGISNDGCSGILECGTCVAPELCDETGRCVNCVQGGACAAPTPCETARMDCSTDPPRCEPDGFVAVGTECGPGLSCDGQGHCQCETKPCSAFGKACGSAPDGCGGIQSCASCTPGLSCNIDGACVECEEGAACLPADPCRTGKMDCGGSAPTCAGDGYQPKGHSCGLNKECDGAGSCGCRATTCDESGYDCGSWPNGCDTTIECGDCQSGKVCNTGGHCVPCIQGDSCAASHVCLNGTVDCGGGAPVCKDGAPKPPGTGCGAGLVCDPSGGCSPCTSGASCAVPNPCKKGGIDCSTGVARCVELGDQPQGTACNADDPRPCSSYACNGSGTCVETPGAVSVQYCNNPTQLFLGGNPAPFGVCVATTFYCPIGCPQSGFAPPPDFSQYSDPPGCGYHGLSGGGNQCQLNACQACTDLSCSNCPPGSAECA